MGLTRRALGPALPRLKESSAPVAVTLDAEAELVCVMRNNRTPEKRERTSPRKARANQIPLERV